MRMMRSFLAALVLTFGPVAAVCGQSPSVPLPEGVRADDVSGTRFFAADADGILRADGDNDRTYALLRAHGYLWQLPEFSKGRPHAARHLVQVWDKTLKRHVFEFVAHVHEDDDFCLPDRNNRQRVEIATAGKTSSRVIAGEGETLRVRWLFRLPEEMKTSTKFCHLHQLKAVSNLSKSKSDIGMPILTFSAGNLSSGKQEFRVVFKPPHSNDNDYLFRSDLATFLGEWLEVEETVTFARDGVLSLTIRRVRDGAVLCRLEGVRRCFWRDGATGVHPKWGIYRSLGEDLSLAKDGTLRDEKAWFADFSVENLK